MAYRLIVLPSAETDLEKLDPEIRRRILRRMGAWRKCLQTIHHQPTNMADDLAGLCRLRVGDYRIVYWVTTNGRS